MKDVNGISSKGIPGIGEVVSVGAGEEGIVPGTFQNSQCFIRLVCIGYFSGEWIIGESNGPGIVCFVPDWFINKRIESVRIETERHKSLVGKPITYVNGKTRCTVK